MKNLAACAVMPLIKGRFAGVCLRALCKFAIVQKTLLQSLMAPGNLAAVVFEAPRFALLPPDPFFQAALELVPCLLRALAELQAAAHQYCRTFQGWA